MIKNKFGNIPLTAKEIEFIKNNYKGTTRKRMCELLYEEFNVVHGEGQIKNIYNKYNLKSGKTGYFEKGHTPWTKGKKQTDFMSQEQIEKRKQKQLESVLGKNHFNYKPIGSKYVTKRGDVVIKIAEPNTWQREHIVVWENTYRKLKDGEKILHLDGNKQNNDINNLVVYSKHELQQIHNVIGLTDNPELNKTIVNIAKLNSAIKKNKE